MKFYQITYTEIEGKPRQVLAKIYRQNKLNRAADAVEEGAITMEDRLGDGKCPECGRDEWLVATPEFNNIDNGGNGKPNIECRYCGYKTHL